jgi:hypothetical protein
MWHSLDPMPRSPKPATETWSPATPRARSTLAKKLALVERNLLDTRPMPTELAAMWGHSVASGGKPFFLEESGYNELRLLTQPSARVDDYTTGPLGAKWAAFFEEVSWIAEEREGGLVGYFHGGAPTLAGAPIVCLENDGSLRLSGPTLVDHLAERKEKKLQSLEAFCAATGLAAPLRPKSRAARLEKLPSPEARLEELARRVTPAATRVRPVATAPLATVLPDRRVLVVTHDDETHEVPWGQAATFLFDPEAFRFSPAANVPITARYGYAGLLSDGRVIVVRRDDSNQVAIFDGTGAWRAGPEHAARHSDAAVALTGDRVLLAGGRRGYGWETSEVSIYDLTNQVWSTSKPLAQARTSAAAASLAGGRVIVIGGYAENKPLVTCELFDPERGAFAPAAALPEPIEYPRAFTSGGHVLVVGRDGVVARYDPEGDDWKLLARDERLSPICVVLPKDRLLCFRDTNATLLDLSTGAISAAGTTLLRRDGSAATALPDGRVLLIGGTLFHNLAAEPEIFDPRTGDSAPLSGFEGELKQQQRALARVRAREGW